MLETALTNRQQTVVSCKKYRISVWQCTRNAWTLLKARSGIGFSQLRSGEIKTATLIS